jgi:D-alanyl-D-alanine carboxypeptidase
VQYRIHGTRDWTTKITATSRGTLPLQNLKAVRSYDVRIRAFRTVGRLRFYGPWSQTAQVTTKKDYTDILILVNQKEGLPEHYVPPDLVAIDGQQLRKVAADAFLAMRKAAARDGVRMSVRSGYRSPEEQRETYAYYVKLEGKEKADRRVAIPGHSEHQTGLAIDISDGYAWAAKHCVEYGFFISSTEANSAITGFRPEPWHIRYVGKDHAKAYTESGLLTYDDYYEKYVNG